MEYVLLARRIRIQFPVPPKNDSLFVLEDDESLAPMQREGWALTEEYIRFLHDFCEEDGATFLLCCAPIAAQVVGGPTSDRFFFTQEPTTQDQDAVRKISTRLGCVFVDLLGPLKESGEGCYFPKDGHWTQKGHRIVAQALVPQVLGELSCEGKKDEKGAL